jgi:hypothetical protein
MSCRIRLRMMKNVTLIYIVLNDAMSSCCIRPQRNEIGLFVYSSVKCAHLLCGKKIVDVEVVPHFTRSLQSGKEYFM